MRTVLAVVLLLLAGGIPFTIETPEHSPSSFYDIPTAEGDEWLLLVYMAGDNNLGRDGYEWGNAVKMDLEEMEDTMPTSGVDILALADMEGPNNTYLYDLEKAPARGVNSPTINLSDVNPSWNDEVDMSNWRTLRDFLVYALTERSANNVMFVLWNHGAGWYSSYTSSGGSRADKPSRGFALDSNSGGAMFLDEFRDAFLEAESALGSLHMDLIGFDTCSMGMMEVYYQVSPWFDLAIGSEDEQPWYGYNYTFVSVMGGTDPYTPVELGNHIIQEFSEQYLIPGEYPYASITMVDLRILMDELTPDMDDLSQHLIERMFQNEVVLNHKFDAVRGRTELLGFENVDIGHFLENLVSSDLHKVIRDNATSALQTYNRTLLGEWHQPDGRNPWATGISGYLPPDGTYRSDYDGDIGFLNYTRDSLWDEMIREFHDPIERVRVDISIQALDGDDLVDDVTVTAVDPRYGTYLTEAKVFIDGVYITDTDRTGSALLKDMYPGTYLFEVYNGTHVGEMTTKVLNRAPVAVLIPAEPVFPQGNMFILDAGSSYDPDGDLLTFKWDLDSSDGLNGSDSTAPHVELLYEDIGKYTVRLTVNDSFLSDHMDIIIEITNAPPVAVIDAPPYVNEDEEFIISAEGSWDTYPDDEELLYLFMLDGAPILNWTEDDSIITSISERGVHNISVRIMDPMGDFGTATKQIQVINVIPVANITGPDDLNEDEVGTFSAAGSTDSVSDLGILNYEWFLDGSPDPVSTNRSVDLWFPNEGSHVLDLRVWDDDGSEDITAYWFSVWNVEPVAQFDLPDQPVFEDEVFTLNASGSYDTPSDRSILNYSWDIDDDGDFELHGLTYDLILTNSGSYNITLAVTDDQGSSDLLKRQIVISNRVPEPEITGIFEGDEDEVLEYALAPDVDTASDLPSLKYQWLVDGVFQDTKEDKLSFSSEFKGNYKIKVIITDDDGDIGTHEVVVRVKNPPPKIILENVPLEVDEGEKFTAVAYRTTDTRSDLASLVFQWYLDGKLLENENGRNITLSIKGARSHELKLVVTDDDGASSGVSMDIRVNEVPLLLRFLESFFSVFVMFMVIALLFLLLLVIFKMNRKLKELPSPVRKEISDDEENSECSEKEGESGTSLKEELDKTPEEEIEKEALPEDPEDGPSDDEFPLEGEEMDLPEPPGMDTPREAPGPPDFGEVELPEVDDSIFDS